MATIFQLVERRRGSVSNIISRVVSDSMDLINSLFPTVQLNYTRRMESQIVCSGCRVLLVYPTGASSIQCGSCNTIIMPTQVQTALVNCLNCHITLMYPYGAESVKCASCQHFTEIRVSNILSPVTPTTRPYNVAEVTPSTSSASSSSQGNNVTVVVENPMSLDEKGKLVNNLVVGVNTNKN